jgi:hypothetical protein
LRFRDGRVRGAQMVGDDDRLLDCVVVNQPTPHHGSSLGVLLMWAATRCAGSRSATAQA